MMLFNDNRFSDAVIELNVYIAIEEHFGIELTDVEVINITTIKELVELIKSKQNEN